MKADEERTRVFLWIRKTTLRVKDGIDNPIYLIRYSLFDCPWFSIKLHRIFMSDDDCMHDHPWSFISIILWRGYVEHSPDYSNVTIPVPELLKKYSYEVKYLKVIKKLYGFGSVLWRPAPSIHKLELFGPAISLVITFRKKREWGFYTWQGWQKWSTFIRSGRKCD